jgi:Asp-tRNA(Asn)/Glu-tRNA(Gln) amidotransferase A subunit family amidase
MNQDLCYWSAIELARHIKTKAVSPLEVVRAHLERIDAVNPRINAIVTMNTRAEDEASAAESAVIRGDELGPLHGVPFTVTDSSDTAALQTTRGSRLFAGRVPAADATAVSRLKASGGILLGKTNVPEFSFWWETANALFGRTVNPWNADRSPGGSSGGEAAAIAAGLSPLGVGSDVGVSIRGPAHYCGIAGLKATHGRIPLTGHWPETLRRFWHVGPMARTVLDLAVALTVLAGPDGHDPYAVPVPTPDIPDGDDPLPPLRVGWMAEPGFGAVDPDVAATVRRAADALQAQGCRVEEVSIPGLERRDCNALTMTLFGAEAGPYFEGVIAGRHEELYPAARRRLAVRVESLTDYLKSEVEVEGLRHDLAEYFRAYDLLLCPVAPVPAFPHEIATLTLHGETLPARHVMRATLPFNLTGSPALAVPFGSSREGLPIGVQIVGRHFDEMTVLRVGMAIENAPGGSWRRPPPNPRDLHDLGRVP